MTDRPARSGRAVRVPLVALAVVGGFLVAGCGGGAAIEAGGLTVLVAERQDGGMEALGGGRLEDVGGCLGASGDVIVWPHGTEVVDDDPLTIDVPDYGTFTVGDDAQIGGGFVVEHSSDDVESGPHDVAGVTVPADCAAHDIFLAN